MIAPMPWRCMSERAFAMRCNRSSAEIGGGIGIDGSSAAACANTRPNGTVMIPAIARPPVSSFRRSIRACNIPFVLLFLGTVARQAAIGQQGTYRAPKMFESAFQEGVKRPGTREMTAMLAALMALNSFAIDAM